MSQPIRNLLLTTLGLPVVIFLSSVLRFPWAEAFVLDRAFPPWLNFFSGGDALLWLFDLFFFFAVGALLAVALRSSRLWAWSIGFSVTYASVLQLLRDNWTSAAADASFYAPLIISFVIPVVGCLAGTTTVVNLRRQST